MAEVIYTREAMRNLRDESRNTHDESIEEFLKEVMKRAMFLHHPLHRNEYFQTFASSFDDMGCPEVVGSTIDGTKLQTVFNVGDFDVLIFSPNLTFDVDDELLFEYRDDDPYFLRILQPKILENKTSAIDGVYMSAHDLRFFRAPLFYKKTSRNYAPFDYDLAPSDEVKSLHKCATTSTSPQYAHVEEKSSTFPTKSVYGLTYTLWTIEYILLSYLLHHKNENELQFVRELLFDDVKGGCETLREKLEISLSSWKEGLQKTLFTNFDICFFNGDDFRKRWESLCQQSETQFDSAVKIFDLHWKCSADYVPAIKCSGWPRPAMDWMDRQRQWPDEKLVEDIVSSGFQLVAKSPPINPTPEKDFILSFSQSEIKLIQALPNTAKMSYHVLKLCYKAIKADVCDGPTLKSFHLKSALFWVAEQTPLEMWESKGILWGIRAIINFLLSKLEQGHLPAFFIPESNLIPHFRVHDSKRLSGILHSIHENPAYYIKLMIEKQIDLFRTLSGDGFSHVFDQGGMGSMESFSWRDLIMVYTIIFGCLDGYPIDQIFDSTSQIQNPTNCLLNCDEGSSTVEFTITDDQLKYVDLFARTVSSFNMDLFNVLDQDIDSSMLDLRVDWINDSSLKLYPSFGAEEDKICGESIYNALMFRLNNYVDVFHNLCCKLFRAVDRPGMFLGNENFNNIVMFLNKLKQKYRYSDENIEDLLHSLFYFCHYTKLRNYSLPPAKQMLRSICEFLQNAQVLMTVYFNPNADHPKPVVCFNISLLEELNK